MIETSYEDEIWLIALTITCLIYQGVFFSHVNINKVYFIKEITINTLSISHREQAHVTFVSFTLWIQNK